MMLRVHRCPVGTVVFAPLKFTPPGVLYLLMVFILPRFVPVSVLSDNRKAILSPWIRSILNAMTIISESSCKVPDVTGASWWIQA